MNTVRIQNDYDLLVFSRISYSNRIQDEYDLLSQKRFLAERGRRGENLALNVLYVQYSLDSGKRYY
jgi:hypothetical protein